MAGQSQASAPGRDDPADSFVTLGRTLGGIAVRSISAAVAEVSATTPGRQRLETGRRHRRREIQRVLNQIPPTDVGVTIALAASGEAAHETGKAEWTAHTR